MTDTPVSDVEQLESPRRRALSGMGSKLGAAAAMGAAALGGATLLSRSAAAQTAPGLTDVDILNFALNFEYLGSNYYLYGVTGLGLPAPLQSGTGTGINITTPQAVSVSGTTLVSFQNPAIQYYGIHLASDEQAHVTAFKTAIVAAAGELSLPVNIIPQPAINLQSGATDGPWSALAQAAGLVPAGASFNPYESDVTFMLGAYILEDVCVTALAGAAGLLQSVSAIQYAAKAIGSEAMQAGAIRGYLANVGAGVATDAISKLRSTLSNVGDNGTSYDSNPFNIANVNPDALVYMRTPAQVLNIAYGAPGTGVTKGGFFPNGVNHTTNGPFST